MRQNGHGALTLEDARTWIEETGLCLFLPRRQFGTSTAPSFVEAVAGERTSAPDPRHLATAEELLVRLELDGIAVRLNLLGQPGELPDFVVAAWVLPYVYALRGDRDWRRSPQLTGSRQVSPLAVQAYKQLEQGDLTLSELRTALGREVTEAAVLRAITELWQQLRIIPVTAAPGAHAKWQLLRHRFQKAIAEGASTSQVTAISVLASIYLQAVIAASMEEVELFLAPLTARSKVREVLRGLVATRQVHTISMGHAPHFYVAGTLPEFTPPQTAYTSSAMPGFFLYARDHEDEAHQPEPVRALPPVVSKPPMPAAETRKAPPETHVPRTSSVQKSATGSKSPRKHFARPAMQTRDRKTAQSSNGGHAKRRTGTAARPSRAFGSNGSRTAQSKRWSAAPARNGNGNGTHKAAQGTNGNGHSNGNGNQLTNGSSAARNGKSAAPSWTKRNGNGNGAKTNGKPVSPARGSKLTRNGSAARKETRSARSKSVKPALAAGAKAGNSKRYGFTARAGRGSKKRK
jgi:hypothetical protein